MKKCTKCKIEKPAQEFHKDSIRADGLRHKCKSCVSDYYKANKERASKRQAAYRAENAERVAAQRAEYYAANRERIASYNADYQRANRERVSAYHAAWYAENREHVAAKGAARRAENRERVVAIESAWRQANPDKCAAKNRNRRARVRNSEGRHTASDIDRILEGQRGLCANCGTKLCKSGKNKFHVDHIVPLAKGGSNWPSNLQCLCPECNWRKGDKDPIEWAAHNGRMI